MAIKKFGVRKGYVWLDRKGLPQVDTHEVTLDDSSPEYQAQKHKLEELGGAKESRQVASPQDRMVVTAPGNRRVGGKKVGEGSEA